MSLPEKELMLYYRTKLGPTNQKERVDFWLWQHCRFSWQLIHWNWFKVC